MARFGRRGFGADGRFGRFRLLEPDLQGCCRRRRCRITVLRLASRHLLADLGQFDRNVAAALAKVQRFLLAWEVGRFTGQQPVEDGAERENVHPGIRLFRSQNLFRRSIGIEVGPLDGAAIGRVFVRQPGHPDIQHLEHSLAVHHEPIRAQTQMQNAMLMGVPHGVGRQANQPGRRFARHRPFAFHHLLQVAALHVFHDQVIKIPLPIDIVDMAQVAMIQSGHGRRLAKKLLDRGRGISLAAGQRLEDHPAVHLGMFGQIDRPDGIVSQQVQQAVLADEQRMSAGQELLGLPAADEVLLNQLSGNGRGFGESLNQSARFIEARCG